MCGVLPLDRQHQQKHGHQEAGEHLEGEFGPPRQTSVLALSDLQVVVDKTDQAEAHHGENHDPDVDVAEVRPQQCGHQTGDENEHAAHGGRARLELVPLRAVFADVLADLELAEPSDQPGAKDDAQKQRGHAGEGGAKGQIAENPEGREVLVQNLIEEPVKHQANLGFRIADFGLPPAMLFCNLPAACISPKGKAFLLPLMSRGSVFFNPQSAFRNLQS